MLNQSEIYIKEIRVFNFMKTQKNICWTLDRHVNVLVGINGSGKSTLLALVTEALSPKNSDELDYLFMSKFSESIEIDLSIGKVEIDCNAKKRTCEIDLQNLFAFVSTFNIPLDTLKRLNKIDLVEMKEMKIQYFLDTILTEYVFNFRKYKQKKDNEILSSIKLRKLVDATVEYKEIDKLYDMLDKAFSETHKSVSRDETPFLFLPQNISFLDLSSGEKQLLILLLAAHSPEKPLPILLLDEPEVSLHLRWQKQLIDNLRDLNSAIQLLIVTHSPTLFSQGYMTNRKNIEEIYVDQVQQITQSVEVPIVQDHVRLTNICNNITDILRDTTKRNIYYINLFLRDIEKVNLIEARGIISHIRTTIVRPDQITFTTLMSRIDTFENGKRFLEIIELENQSDRLLNTLLKKAHIFELALDFMKEYAQKTANFPDIITFSTLLGKAKNIENVKAVEEQRNYYDIKANDIYLSKLKYWKYND